MPDTKQITRKTVANEGFSLTYNLEVIDALNIIEWS